MSNISRGKGNQVIKYGQNVIWELFFQEKSYTNCDRENIPRPFSQKLELSISLDQ